MCTVVGHSFKDGGCVHPGQPFNAAVLVVRFINTVTHRGAEAPGWQGATTEEYRQYLREEQRSQPGCIGGRMPPYL
jgi:hypothetical protein